MSIRKNKVVKKIAVLWPWHSGYLNACLKTLRMKYIEKILLIHFAIERNTSFFVKRFRHLGIIIEKEKQITANIIRFKLLEFQLDVILVVGCISDKCYLKIIKY